MTVLSKVLGRFAPGYQTLQEWSLIYDQILLTRNISAKTLGNKRNCVRHLVNRLGTRSMRSIKPLDISQVVRDTWSNGYQFTAQRILIEAVDMFNEAVIAGVVQTNPAMVLKRPPAKVARSRLILDQWQTMYKQAPINYPPWVSRLLLLALVTGQRRADLQKMSDKDAKKGHLFVVQQKTGTRIALPLQLRLKAIDWSIEEVVDHCRDYAPPGETLIRKSTGEPLSEASLSYRFTQLFDYTHVWNSDKKMPTLHECRSLSERLYRAEGIDTKTLLGHKHQSTTDEYNNDRGLSDDDWTFLSL